MSRESGGGTAATLAKEVSPERLDQKIWEQNLEEALANASQDLKVVKRSDAEGAVYFLEKAGKAIGRLRLSPLKGGLLWQGKETYGVVFEVPGKEGSMLPTLKEEKLENLSQFVGDCLAFLKGVGDEPKLEAREDKHEVANSYNDLYRSLDYDQQARLAIIWEGLTGEKRRRSAHRRSRERLGVQEERYVDTEKLMAEFREKLGPENSKRFDLLLELLEKKKSRDGEAKRAAA
ncbi:MAG: hypothetical protein HY396_01605 [Candidatus Doudnabacteria bacterium]|nr:hypothetical protein [Candidatus Doudnabacteria bacterium]